MVENVSFDGEYRRGMILLNARLAGKERIAVLRHEAYHSRFYEFTSLGRFLDVFCGKRVGIGWSFLMGFLLLFVNPFVYLFASVPLLLVSLHEAVACIRFGGKSSFVWSVLGILVVVLVFGVRLAFY